jgi:predicted restriction endonuclease
MGSEMVAKLTGSSATIFLEEHENRVMLFKKDNTDKLWSYKLKTGKKSEFAFDPNTTTKLNVRFDECPPQVKGVDKIEAYPKSNKSPRTSLARVFSGGKHNAKYKATIISEEAFVAVIDYFESSIKNNIGKDKNTCETNEVESPISKTEQDSLVSDTKHLTTDERQAVVKVRYGQGPFRDALIRLFGEKCWMSGIEGKQLLVASHIKPWSHCDSDPNSRGQTNNGLLLSALWDSAFDSGLITFDQNWDIVVSSKLPESARDALDIHKFSNLPEKFRNEGRSKYLAYHRKNVFQC